MADHTASTSLSTFEDETTVTTGAKHAAPTQHDRVTTPTHDLDLDPKLSLLYDTFHSINDYPEYNNFISRNSRLPVAQSCSNGVKKRGQKC